MARRDFGVAVAGLGIEALVAEREFLGDRGGRPEEHGDQAVAGLEGKLERIGQARLDAVADLEAIDHGLDDMGARFFQARRLLKLDDLPVHARAHEAFAPQFFHHVAELALLALHDRGEDLDGRALLRGEDAVDHLLHRPAPERLARFRVV